MVFNLINNRFLLLWLTTIIFLVSGCAQKSELDMLKSNGVIKSENFKPTNIEYKILPQDRLKIILYKDLEQIGDIPSAKLGENLNPAGILVDARGYVKLPLVGKVKVAGLTQTKASDKIEKLYKKKLTNPSIYLEILNKRLFVLGEVKKQGVVKLDKEKITLFEAIATCGGFTDDAIRDNILIISHNKSGMHIRKVGLTNFDNLRYTNLILRPNDLVYVQPNRWKKFKVSSDNFTSPFVALSKIISPFATINTSLLDNRER